MKIKKEIKTQIISKLPNFTPLVSDVEFKMWSIVSGRFHDQPKFCILSVPTSFAIEHCRAPRRAGHSSSGFYHLASCGQEDSESDGLWVWTLTSARLYVFTLVLQSLYHHEEKNMPGLPTVTRRRVGDRWTDRGSQTKSSLDVKTAADMWVYPWSFQTRTVFTLHLDVLLHVIEIHSRS